MPATREHLQRSGACEAMPGSRASESCSLAFLNKLHEDPGLVELARRMDAELHVIEWAEPDPDVFGAYTAATPQERHLVTIECKPLSLPPQEPFHK